MIDAHQMHLCALVSGIPEPQCSAKVLVMLQALIDESDSQEVGPRVFVMGGYIASVRQWKKLTDEWAAELKCDPHLPYFSFQRAFSPEGKPRDRAYRGSKQARDIRFSRFKKIIADNVTAQFGIAFRVADFQSAYGTAARFNHYSYSMIKLTTSVPFFLNQLGLGQQKIDLIFDKREHEERLLTDAWSHAKEYAKPAVPDVFKKILVNAPVFCSSKTEVIALQAADLFVGSVRASNIAMLNGREPSPLWAIEKTIPRVFLAPTAEHLRADAKDGIA